MSTAHLATHRPTATSSSLLIDTPVPNPLLDPFRGVAQARLVQDVRLSRRDQRHLRRGAPPSAAASATAIGSE